MNKLLTYYTTEELNQLNGGEDYDFLELMDLKRPFHMDQLVFRIDGIYKRATLIKENKTTAQFLIDGEKISARYDRNGYHIKNNYLQEMSDDEIIRFNFVKGLDQIGMLEFMFKPIEEQMKIIYSLKN